MSGIPALEALVRRARAGEPVRDVQFFELLRALEREPPARASRSGPALYALLRPGRRGGGFYLDDAFGEPLREARAACGRAEAAVAAQRDAVRAEVRARCGIDVTGEEFIVLRGRYDGSLPDGVAIVRETPRYRHAAIRIDTGARDAALEALQRAEREARRALAEAIALEAERE